MNIKKVITIAENSVAKIEQTDCGKVLVNYSNASISFNKGSFLNFLIEIDDWVIKNFNNSMNNLSITGCRFKVDIRREDLAEFLNVVTEASYRLVPLLNMYRQIDANEKISSNLKNILGD